MGISVKCGSSKVATLKIYNLLSSYLFEQECGELRGISQSAKKKLSDAQKVLADILKKGMK